MKTQPHQTSVRPLSQNPDHSSAFRLKTPGSVKVFFVLLASSFALYAEGAEPQSGVPFVSTGTFDQLWSHATLYKDARNPILQEFKLRGRYHGQYWDVDDSTGSQSDWEDRRSRLGFDAKLFEKKLEIRADFQSNDGFNDIYDGLVDAYLRWKPVSWLSITAGKTKPLIGQYRLAGIHQFPAHLRAFADLQSTRDQPCHRTDSGRHFG